MRIQREINVGLPWRHTPREGTARQGERKHTGFCLALERGHASGHSDLSLDPKDSQCLSKGHSPRPLSLARVAALSFESLALKTRQVCSLRTSIL